MLFKDGSKIRPWADNAGDGDAYIIEQWNSVVSPSDKVYLLGDITMKKEYLSSVARLNGRKILILGNHDKFNASVYLDYFDDVKAVDRIDKFVLSHIPIHPDSIPHWAKVNIHGHTHKYLVMNRDQVDTRYFNVCLEVNDCLPVDFEHIKKLYT